MVGEILIARDIVCGPKLRNLFVLNGALTQRQGR